MAVYADTVTGTITLTSGSNAFTTSGVNMLTRGHLPGDSIYRNGFVLIIETITTENAGTLRDPCPAGAAGSAVPVRIRYQPDGSRVQAQARNLIERLGNGNLEAFAGLTGPGVVVFNTPSSLVVKPEADFINGIDFDVQVNTLAERAAYDGQSARYRVLVNNVGDGRSALYSKLTNTNADWSDPAYITGATGATPVVTASSTTLAPGASATVTTTPITGGVNLALGIPAGRSSGFSYTWSTTVTDANPGNGFMRANNASLASATLLFISKTSVNGAAMATFLLNIASSTSPNKGELTIQRIDTGATATYVVNGVTDATNYVKVSVSTHSGVTTITNNTLVDFFFSRTGNSGSGDGDVKGPAVSVNNRLASFNGTTGKLIADSGLLSSEIALLNAANIFNGVQTFTGAGQQIVFRPADATSLSYQRWQDETGAAIGYFGLDNRTTNNLTFRRNTVGNIDIHATTTGTITLTGAIALTTLQTQDVAWSLFPIGVPIPIQTNLVGVNAPPTNRPYRYIKLTASDSYNSTVLGSESVTGSGALVQATAVVTLSASTLNGQTIRLINTERRFLRAGSVGTLENDQMQTIVGTLNRVGSNRVIFQSGTGAFSVPEGTDNSISAGTTTGAGNGNVTFNSGSDPSTRTGTETRPKNIGVDYYMRIL